MARQKFGNLDRICCRPFTKVVADTPEREAVRIGKVLADPADKDKITARTVAGHWIATVGLFINDLDARKGREQSFRLRHRNRPFRFNENRLAVTVDDRHPDACWAHPNRGITQNLPRFVDQLQLFTCIAMLLKSTN